MSESEPNITKFELPSEWAWQKVLEPVLTEVGEDFRRLYIATRDNVVLATCHKIADAARRKIAQSG